MPRHANVAAFALTILALSWRPAGAEVVATSPFAEARHPASELDLLLFRMQEIWSREVVREPSAEFAAKNRLVAEAGVGIELSYKGEDVITIHAWIKKVDGFLRFTTDERKQLVRDVLRLVKNALLFEIRVYASTQATTWGRLEDANLELYVLISNVLTDDTGRNIRIASFPQIDIGQAAFRKGTFVYSRPYYLDLRVENGVAVSGGNSALVVEEH